MRTSTLRNTAVRVYDEDTEACRRIWAAVIRREIADRDDPSSIPSWENRTHITADAERFLAGSDDLSSICDMLGIDMGIAVKLAQLERIQEEVREL